MYIISGNSSPNLASATPTGQKGNLFYELYGIFPQCRFYHWCYVVPVPLWVLQATFVPSARTL